MRIRAAFALFVLAVVLALSPLSAHAQVATGNPPFASLGGGPFDTVNLANLNVHFGIPVVSKAGRGIPFNYTLVYDSAVWYPVGSSGSQVWTPVANFGWAGQTQVKIGYVTYTAGQTKCFGDGQWWFAPTGNRFVYHDSFGAAHGFNTGLVGGCNGTEVIVTATDSSGYTIDAFAGGATIYSSSGQTIYPPIQTSSGSGSAFDSNGNEITVSGSTFTDTLGTAALTVSGQGTPSSPLQFQYTSPRSTLVGVYLNYTNYTVKTNFQCSGISEYGPTQIALVSSVGLPDGTSYTIHYEATLGYSGDVTGRIASITLPTGGTISYSYGPSGVNGITCADGSASTLTRTTPDGIWTYAHSESGTAWTTTVTDPQNNQTIMNFQGIYETERQIYQGSTLLGTAITCYNGNTSNCNSTAITLPITQRTVFLQWPGGKESETNLLYNSFGLMTENDEYDYGNGAPGSLVRKTLISYASLGNNIVDRPATVNVEDGSGAIKAQTTYSYDQTGVTATSGTPQHVAISGSRGNPTTISYLVQGSTTLNKTYTYYDTGTVATTTDVNGASTTFSYGSGSCGNSFETSISLALSLSRSQTWNCTGGVPTSVTDVNGKPISTTYNDPYFWRPTSITDATSNVTNFTYTGATSIESSLTFNGSNSAADVLSNLDGLGRVHVAQIRQSPSSGNFDSVETDYDTLGRPSRVTLPYTGTAGQTNSTAPSLNAIYDALSRATQGTDAGGGTATASYTQNDVLFTAGPAPSGENTKRRQFEYDGLGRLTSVCEITSATGSGTCAQTSSQVGYWTKYAYDPLGDLISVTQNAQSSNTQTRTYAFDGLGRMTSETNPESGTTTYVYDSDSTCGTSSGDLVKQVDAIGNVICYAHDALHRLTSSFVSSGSYASVTPKKYFVYDSATVNGVVMANANGRLAEAYTCTSPCTSKITDIGFSYTSRGEVSDLYESTPHSSGYYHVTASYWANGVLDQLSNLSGLPTITYNVDGEGRVHSVSASTGQNPLSSALYNTASEPTQVNLGSLDSDVYSYDPNTDRMTQYQFNVNSQSEVGNLSWNFNGTLGGLTITDPFNSANAQSCSYSHDDLGRIGSANCGPTWSQTFTNDAFGNLDKSGSQSFQPTYSYLTNHMTQIGSSTPTYDSNGNVTNDFLHTYSWDANGLPVTIDGVGVTYDALGRMVEQNSGSSYTEIVYDPTGAKLALMNGQSLQKAFVSLAGGSIAVYNSSGLAYYRHTDWLGSSRLASTPSRGVYSDTAYGPYGEAYAQSGTTDLSFTGMNQDTVPNLYDFPAREYGIQGRWPSPDPAGLAAVDLSDPQTLNRYAYVRNSPLEFVDPSGMVMCEITITCGGDGGGGDGYCPPWFEYCGVPVFDLGFIGSSGGGGPVGIPGPPRIGTTGPTFPTASGIDWTSLIFGPPDPSLLIYSFCFDKLRHIVACDSPGAYTNCGDNLYSCTAMQPGFVGPPLPPWCDPIDGCPISGPPKARELKPTKPRSVWQRGAGTYFGQYFPCALGGLIDEFLGDSDKTKVTFVVHLAPFAANRLPFGPVGVVIALGGAAAYDLHGSLRVRTACTQQVYGAS